MSVYLYLCIIPLDSDNQTDSFPLPPHSSQCQVYPPLLNPKNDADKQRRSEAPENDNKADVKGAGKKGAGGVNVDDFLKDASTARMVNSRPGSARPGSGRGGTPAGGGMAAAAALRAS